MTREEPEAEGNSELGADGGVADVDLAEAERDRADRRTSVQSPVITTAARTVTPFVLAYGVYLTLHGTALPGGAFQGGIVLGTTIVLIGLAFGFAPTREWIHDGAFAATLLFGIGVFGGFALGAVALGGDVLEVFAYPLAVEYTVKVVEVAIAAVVAGVVCGLVIWIAAGVDEGGHDG